MFCRYLKGNRILVDVRGMFLGQTVFVVGGSPTLLRQNYRLLELSGVVSIGINNMPSVVKTTMGVMGDLPPCFDDRYLHNPSILKFAKGVHYMGRLRGGETWRDMPSTVFFDQLPGPVRGCQDPDNFVYASNNTLEMCLSLILTMGVSRIVLVGCSFDSGYSYGASLKGDEKASNRRLYDQQVGMLKDLAPLLSGSGVELVDSSLNSRLSDTFRTCSLEDSISEALSEMPPRTEPDRLAYAASLYDKGGKAAGTAEPPCPGLDSAADRLEAAIGRSGRLVVTGLGLYGGRRKSAANVLLLFSLVRSYFKSRNSYRMVVFLDCGEAEARAVSGLLRRGALESGGAVPDVAVLSKSVLGCVPIPYGRPDLGVMSAVRLYLFRLLKGAGRCIWLDHDCIVRGDLGHMFDEAGATGRAICGVRDYNRPDGGAVNSGVLCMDLDALRRGEGQAVVDAYKGSLGTRTPDQDAVNSVGVGILSDKWNVQGAPFMRGFGNPSLVEGASVLHASGPKAWAHSCSGAGCASNRFLSEYLAEVNGDLESLTGLRGESGMARLEGMVYP